MGYIVPNEGEREILDDAFTMGVYVGLFINNHTPSESTTYSSLTECSDMDYTGAGRKSLSLGSATTVGGKAVKAATSAVSWTFNPDGMRTPFTVYGYFVTKEFGVAASGVIRAIERFASPYYIDAGTTQVISVGGPFKFRLYDPNS